MPMLIILGGLAGLTLTPNIALATLPASVQTLAGLFAAAPFSILMGRLGRKTGFVTGALLACASALLGAFSLIYGNFVLLCIAHLGLGAALACYQYFRFAAAEAVRPNWQPVAISLMLTSGLVAAFAGPQLFIMSKDAFGATPLAGAYVAIAVISLIGLLPLVFVHMPPLAAAKGLSLRENFAALSLLKHKPIRTAVGLGAASQGTMIFMMVPTPLAMIGCGLSEDMAGDVIRWHVVAMFAPSFFTGFLIKRFGTGPIALIGLSLLIAAAITAMLGLNAHNFYGSLILLGVGWNFGFIGATNLLATVVPEEEKAVVQGANDTFIALASTICAFAAGAVVSGFGWTLLAIIALVVLIIALGSFVIETRGKPVSQ